MSDEKSSLLSWPLVALVLAGILGTLVLHQSKSGRAKKEGIERSRPGCVETLGAAACEEHLELYADECFRMNYVSSGGRYSSSGAGLSQSGFDACIVKTPEVWDAEDRAARREARMRERDERRAILGD